MIAEQSTTPLVIMYNSRTWTLGASVLCLHILFNSWAAEGAFISPSSPIDKLVSRGQVWADPSCNTLDCHPAFNAASCLTENVCYENRTCNGRTDLPPVEKPLSTWNQSSSSSSCLLSLKSVTFPTLSSSSVQTLSLVVNGSTTNPGACYFQRKQPLGPVFTLVFWISAFCRDCSVIDVIQTDGRSIHLTIVNETLLCLDKECHSYSPKAGSLVMMSLQVIDKKMKIFVNKTKIEFSNTDAVSFQLKDVLIGSAGVPRTNNTFEMVYIQYYSDALTSNELLQLWSGMPAVFNDYMECQCPANYIDLLDTDMNMCTDGNNTYPRFNKTVLFYTVRAILDASQNKKWALSGYYNTTLTFDFSSKIQIDRIDMTFAKEVPNTIQATFGVDAFVGQLQDLSCINKVCSLILPDLTSTTSFNHYNQRLAKEIYIDIIGGLETKNQRYILTNLTISGRCGCHGNADSCNEINGTFVCNCKPESHTQGDDCKTCSPSYYLSPDQLSCSDRCQCNTDGVASTANPCDQSGQCLCKANVEGRLCDTCKPYTYNLSGTNSLGCTRCSCGQQGSYSCSNITGDCKCKENTDQTCHQCKDNFYGITDSKGCKPCNCSLLGTVNQSMSCNETTGQCLCKLYVEGLQCNACKPGYYKLEAASVRGCTECKCDAVGSESAKCDPRTGQCLCREGLITDQYCSPQILLIDPVYGPDSGGTLVTIQGRLLGSDKSKTFVYIGDVAQSVISVQDSQLIFQTVYNNVTALSSLVIKLSWELTNRIIDTKTNFTFKPNPVIYPNTSSAVQTFLSGGSPVYIYGSNLQSVKYPRLEILNPQISNYVAVGTCRHNPTNVICAVPNMTDVYRSPKDSLQMTIYLDGLISRTLFNISVKPDPVFDHVGNIRFQYPFEDTITLTGKGFTAAGGNVYTVHLGVVACAVTSVSDSEIVCRPAVSPLSGETVQTIEIRVGNIKKKVGTLEYLKLHETTNFIIIISCISGGIFLILVGIAIIFIYRRYKRNHKSTSTFSNLENKNTARPVTEVAVPNHYAETTTKVDTQPKQNGASELVRMETVIKEPKLGFVNSQADDTFFTEEFLPKVEAGLRDEIKQCFIAGGHFAVGRTCHKKGKQAMLTDGSLQNTSSISGQKLTIKTLINPIKETTLPPWANLALAECLRLKRHKHIHVLSVLGVGVDRERFHILYPSMSQNFLKSVVADNSKQFSVRQLLSFASQVAEGLCFLASKDITHKDVAARNCMVDENTVVKLSDASFSWDFYPDEYVYDDQRERYLPLRWMAPESLSDGYYDMRTDVWSLAILIWELMTRGCLPFQEVANESVKNYIIGGYVLGKPETLSDPMYELLCQCWSLENEYRPSIGDVTRSLGEIVETEDDIYENIVSYSSSAASPNKHFPSGTDIYSVSNMSSA